MTINIAFFRHSVEDFAAGSDQVSHSSVGAAGSRIIKVSANSGSAVTFQLGFVEMSLGIFPVGATGHGVAVNLSLILQEDPVGRPYHIGDVDRPAKVLDDVVLNDKGEHH